MRSIIANDDQLFIIHQKGRSTLLPAREFGPYSILSCPQTTHINFSVASVSISNDTEFCMSICYHDENRIPIGFLSDTTTTEAIQEEKEKEEEKKGEWQSSLFSSFARTTYRDVLKTKLVMSPDKPIELSYAFQQNKKASKMDVAPVGARYFSFRFELRRNISTIDDSKIIMVRITNIRMTTHFSPSSTV